MNKRERRQLEVARLLLEEGARLVRSGETERGARQLLEGLAQLERTGRADERAQLGRWVEPRLLAPSEVFTAGWPPGLSQDDHPQVDCDDKGREGGCWLKVGVAPDGDVHVSMMDWEHIKTEPDTMPYPFPTIRVRTLAGGGRNLRTRQALLWLMLAMKLDRQDHEAGRR